MGILKKIDNNGQNLGVHIVKTGTSSAVPQSFSTAPAAQVPKVPEQDDPNLVQRIANIITGAGRSTAAGVTNVGGTVLSSAKALNDIAYKQNTAQQRTAFENSLAYWQGQYDNAKTQEERAKAKTYLDRAKSNLYGIDALKDWETQSLTNAAQKAYERADTMAEKSAQDVAQAKQGLGKVGSTLVDVGVAGTQMLGDAAVNLLAPGAGLAAMGVRSFGSGAQEARQKGATLAQQIGYGAATAGVEVLTEKMFDGLSGIYGKGAFDDVVDGVINKMATTGAGKNALKVLSSMGEEATEEVVSGLVGPALQSIFDGQSAASHYTKDTMKDVLHDAIVGGILGGIGGGTQVIRNWNAAVSQNNAQDARSAEQVGNLTDKNKTPTIASNEATEGIIIPPAQNAELQATVERGRSDRSSGNVATQEDAAANNSVAQSEQKSSDELLNILLGGKGKATQSDADAFVKQYGEDAFTKAVTDGVNRGAAAMDAGGNLYRVNASEHIDNRTSDNVGDRKLPAFQYQHPEVQPYYKEVAAVLLDELGDAQKGGQIVKVPEGYDENGVWQSEGYYRTKRGASDGVAKLLDDQNLSYADIEKALNAIINDAGQENFAAAKRAEMVIDDLIESDYRSKWGDISTLIDRDGYLAAKGKITGAAMRSDVDALADVDALPTEQSETPLADEFGGRTNADILADEKVKVTKPFGDGRYATVHVNVDGEVSVTFERSEQAAQKNVANYEAMLGHGMETVDTAQEGSIQQAIVNIEASRNAERGEYASREYGGVDAMDKERESLARLEAQRQRGMDDGLGGADAGTLNTSFQNMQAQSDTFYPVNQNAAQREAETLGRAPEEVPVVNPNTQQNIKKTVSTILNAEVTSNEMAPVLEQAVADGKFDYAVVTDADAMTAANETIKREGGYQKAASNFIAKATFGRPTKNDFTVGIACYNEAVASGDTATAFQLASALADAAHTSAQVVQAVNIFNRLTPTGRLLTLRRLVDTIAARQNESGKVRKRKPKEYADKLDAIENDRPDLAVDEDLATAYLLAETDADRAEAWQNIINDIASKMPPTIKEKWDAWRYTAMLTNPVTHVRNFTGNTVQAGMRRLKNAVGAAMELTIRDKSKRTKAILTTSKADIDLKRFARDMYAQDQSAAMGEGKYSEGSRGQIEQEIRKARKMFGQKSLLGKGVQAVSDFNTAALEAEDLIFNRGAYVDSLAQALKAKGITYEMAMDGQHEAEVASARAYAIEEAAKATYRDSNAFSDFVSKLGSRSGNENIVEAAAKTVVDSQLPFRRTPANILVRGTVDYSPIGIVKSLAQVASGKIDAVQFIDGLSSGLTGTGVLALGAYLTAEGLLHIKAGDDDKEEAFLKSVGAQDFALQIGDASYTLDWLVPAAMPLFAGAAIMTAGEDADVTFTDILSAMGGISDVMTETSMLSSLDSLIENWSYADNKVWYLLSSSLTNYLGQAVPTIGGKVASAMDDTVRKSYVQGGKNSVEKDADYFLQSVMKKMPAAREKLQPSVDVWGNEVSNGNTTERVLEAFVSPGYYSKERGGKVNDEVRRLADKVGSNVYPNVADKSFPVDGKTKYLTAEEYTKYAKKLGETRYKAVEKLIGSSGYNKLSDAQKAEAISDIYEYANVIAKQSVSNYQPSESSWVRGALKSPLSIENYVLYRMNSDRDGNGSTSGAESAQTLLEIMGISDKTRGDTWAQKNSTMKQDKNPFTGALSDVGVDAETATKILAEYTRLNATDGKPRDNAQMLKAYCLSLGLTPVQMAVAKNTFKWK